MHLSVSALTDERESERESRERRECMHCVDPIMRTLAGSPVHARRQRARAPRAPASGPRWGVSSVMLGSDGVSGWGPMGCQGGVPWGVHRLVCVRRRHLRQSAQQALSQSTHSTQPRGAPPAAERSEGAPRSVRGGRAVAARVQRAEQTARAPSLSRGLAAAASARSASGRGCKF